MSPHFSLMLVVLCLSGGNAVLRKEYRIPLPFTLEQYRIGHLWSTWKWSVLNTGGGEGVEVVTNEPRQDYTGEMGQFTHKVYHLDTKLPDVVGLFATSTSLEMHENSLNMFTNVMTIIEIPDFMNDEFHIVTYTRLVAADNCDQDGVFSDITSDIDSVNRLDIVNDPVENRDYKSEEDPMKCHTRVGNLSPDWQRSDVRMCVYKLVEAEFMWFGLQGRVERRIHETSPRYFRNLHRQMFCWADKWMDLSIDDIRAIEGELQDELDELRATGEVRGMSEQ